MSTRGNRHRGASRRGATRHGAAWRRALGAAIAVLLHAPLSAAAAECARDGAMPPSFRLGYSVHATRGILSLSGDNELRFERDGDRYRLVSETGAPPLYAARQSSSGAIGPQGLIPHRYAEIRTRRAEAKVTFDWKAREVLLGTGARAPLQPRMQDRLSLLLEVGRLLGGNPAPNPAPVQIVVASAKRVEPYVFAMTGRETVEVPAGSFATLRIERTAVDPANEREDRLELWIAPALCALPVRVRYRDEHGLVVENTLKSIELRR